MSEQKNLSKKSSEIENLIIAVLINGGDPIFQKSGLREDVFRSKNAKQIFRAMIECEAEGDGATNYAAIYLKLSDSSRDVFDEKIVNRLSQTEQANPVYLPNYISTLQKINKALIVQDVIEEYSSTQPEIVADKILEALNQRAMEIPDDYTDEVLELYSEIERLFESKGEITGISTGYKSLDAMIYGLNPGELYIIAARPSIGKSVLSLNMAMNVAGLSGKRVYVQALEETRKNILKRMTSNITGIPLHALMSGNIYDNQWERLARVADDVKRLNLIIDDTGGLTAGQIISRIRSVLKTKPLDVVIIDHILEIMGDNPKENRHQQISRALTMLKAFAKKAKFALIIVAQINRAVEARGGDKRPMMSDLKESGDLEAKADTVMLLYRESYYNREMRVEKEPLEIMVSKNRNGRTGSLELEFDGARMRIAEYNAGLQRKDWD